MESESRMVSLTDINKETFKNYLKSLNSTTECELRFGKYVYLDNNRKEFVANVEIDFFYRLKNLMDSEVGLEKTTTFTKELSFDNTNGVGKIRETIYTNSNFEYIKDKKSTFMLKNTHKKHNLFDYDCRISMSSEKQLLKESIKGINFNNPTFIRYKNRNSYKFDCGTIDITIVHQGINEELALLDTRYEIEFEITKNDYDSILQIMSFILQTKQNNFYIINSREKNNVINQYKSLVMPQKQGHPYFIGAQPETLQKDQLSLLFKELYSVTDKADGDRYFMFIDSFGLVSFIDSNINNILRTNLTSKFNNTIIDGELIKTNDNISFYAFDILFFNKIDLRGDINYLLRQRLEKLNEVVKNITSNELYIIKMKTFIYRNVFMGSDIIMNSINEKPYNNDGLIFTPMNEVYPKNKKWSKLLKWKPSELNTIDFFSVKKVQDGKEIWELYVQDFVNQESDQKYLKKTNLVLFDTSKLCINNELNTKNVTFKTSFSKDLLDPTTKEAYKTNTVIEYKWDNLQEQFIPLRTRWDKTANKSKHGNFSSVACSIWNNINNPITQIQLFQMTNSSTEQVTLEKPFFFERMNKFHSKVNEYLINKYIFINKTVDNNTKIIDNKTTEYIIELNTLNQVKGNFDTFTFCNLIKKSNFNYKNFKLDLTNDNSCSIIKKTITELNLNKKVNSIFCLKFNTFFKSQEILDNFIHIIDYNLQSNGKLILSFIDKDCIKKHTCIINNQIMYNIDTQNDLEKKYSSTKIFINGISNENETLEYTIDYEFLITYFKQRGYTCVETELYKNLYKLYPKTLFAYEENISDIYRYCIFQKDETNINTVINTVINTTLPKLNMLIEHKNLQYYKIKTTHDIYDIVNCIKYTIFKNNYENNKILSYHDINVALKNTDFNCLNAENMNQSTKNNESLYFHRYIFKELIEDETLTEFYIVFYKNKINHTNNIINIIHNIIENNENNESVNNNNEIVNGVNDINNNNNVNNNNNESLNNESVNNKVNNNETINVNNESVNKESVNVNKESVINEIKLYLKGKTNILKLKEYLKILNSKTTGNKKDILERLSELIKN